MNKSITKQLKTQNAAQFLLGSDVLVVDAQKWTPNHHITIQSWKVNYPEQHLPNQFGQIICPKMDHKDAAIQLMYLKHHITAKSTAIIYSIYFEPEFLAQWDEQSIFSEEALNENNAGLQVAFCAETQAIIDELSNCTVASNFSQKLRQMELSVQLMRKAIDHIGAANDTYSVPACGFLSNNSEREKVLQAREILEGAFDQMLSIKELARRVAINECYLKKGFKAMFGKTINEFQQQLRISKAKNLLQIDGLTVSEVANTLGYSSISHFSTAFKKATNMKPCELLK
jgi:AraC-like DNA-binding protein